MTFGAFISTRRKEAKLNLRDTDVYKRQVSPGWTGWRAAEAALPDVCWSDGIISVPVPRISWQKAYWKYPRCPLKNVHLHKLLCT